MRHIDIEDIPCVGKERRGIGIRGEISGARGRSTYLALKNNIHDNGT